MLRAFVFARRLLAFGFWIALSSGSALAIERIKEVATISGVRANPVVGYGLVVGMPNGSNQEANR